MRTWCSCTKTLPNLTEDELRIVHSHVMEVSLRLVSLFLGHSEDGLIHTYITFQMFQHKNFLGIYTDDLNESSPKLQCLYLTSCHPHQVGSIPGQPRTSEPPSIPLGSEVEMQAFSSALVLHLWQDGISMIPLGTIKKGPIFVYAESRLFSSIQRELNKENNDKLKIIFNTLSCVSATFLDFFKEMYVRLLWNQWSLNLAVSALYNKLFLKMTNH